MLPSKVAPARNGPVPTPSAPGGVIRQIDCLPGVAPVREQVVWK